MRIFSNPNRNITTQKASDKLRCLLKETKNHSTLLLLSGGSSLALLNDVEPKNISKSTTITVLDERYSRDPDINNFAQIAALNFYKDSKAQGAKFIDTRVKEQETQAQLAARFEHALENWIEKNPEGKIIATIGIGDDAHIAGIMPAGHHEKFKKMFASKNLVTAYDAGDKNQYPLRVTTTLSLIKRIDFAVVYVVGEKKRTALKNILSKTSEIHAFPAVVLNNLKNVTLFTDIK